MAAGAEIERNLEAVNRELGEQYGAIFAAHLQMLRDKKLRSELDDLIRERHYSPEYAVSRALRRLCQGVSDLGKQLSGERANDIFDIEKRLLRNLLGRRREELGQLISPVLVLAHNLTPSETANLNRNYVRGFATEIGGPGSHTAIVAEGLEIPAVVGTGPFLSDVSGGDIVIIDGDQGLVIVQPDEETLAPLPPRGRAASDPGCPARRPARTARRNGPTESTSNFLAISSFPTKSSIAWSEAATASAFTGLYRTEFLYLGAEVEPTEEVHYEAYASVIKDMAGRPVVIRTLDLGADKLLKHQDPDPGRNPFLGLRSIRLSLKDLPLFRTQLRAILRASVLGDVRVMFPLVSTLLELRQAKMVLADVMEDLEEQGVPFTAIWR